MSITNPQISTEPGQTVTKYYIPSKGELSFSPEDLKNVNMMKYNTFDQFKKRAFKIWVVEIPAGNYWKKGRCTCPHFLKIFICKHVIGIAIRLKLVKPPPIAKNVPIGQKAQEAGKDWAKAKKRGRPKKATRALLVD